MKHREPDYREIEIIDCSPEALRVADAHLAAMLEYNKLVNLTAITDPAEARRLHLEDSLRAAPALMAGPDGPAADLGSGGGFPGLPLGICTGRSFVLVESVKKKCAFLSAFIAQNHLDEQFEVYPGRAESLAVERPGAFAVVTARALTQLPSLVELASPLLMHGGRLIALKARLADDEMEAGLRAARICGMELTEVHDTELSGGESRRILVFELNRRARVKLPRRVGMAQSKPLA